MFERQGTSAFQTSNNYAECHTGLPGKVYDDGTNENFLQYEHLQLHERLQRCLKNELTAREAVHFFLFLFPVNSLELNEHISASMLENVPSFMKEGELSACVTWIF